MEYRCYDGLENIGEHTVSNASRDACPLGGSAAPFVFDSFLKAHREAQRRRASDEALGLFTRVEQFPYGPGFIVRSVPIALLTESLVASVFIPPSAYSGT